MAHDFKYDTAEAREVLRAAAPKFTDRIPPDAEKQARKAASTTLLNDAAALLKGYGYDVQVMVYDVQSKATAHAFRRIQGGFLVIPVSASGKFDAFVQHDGDKLKTAVTLNDLEWDPALGIYLGPWAVDDSGKRVRRDTLAVVVERVLQEVLS